MAPSLRVVEFGNTSPSKESLCETRTINATGSHQGKEERRTLVVPVVGAWGADDRYVVVVTGETRAIPRALSLLDLDSGAPLMRGASCVSFLSLDRSSLVV
jgi:hypothetical protein